MSDDRTLTTRSQVTFDHPFMLRGFDRPHPAGTFDVDIDSERIEGSSVVAYRHVATFIYLRDGSATRMVSVEAADLSAAREADRDIDKKLAVAWS